MSKKRTRKQKENASHNFMYSWDKNPSTQISVNRETGRIKNPNIADTSVKKEIVRSLLISSLVLALELVIYFAR